MKCRLVAISFVKRLINNLKNLPSWMTTKDNKPNWGAVEVTPEEARKIAKSIASEIGLKPIDFVSTPKEN